MIQFDALRWLLVCTILSSGIVLAIFGARYLWHFKVLSRGQKLYIGAMLMFVISLSWVAAEAIHACYGLKLSLVPFVIGLALCFAYLVDPSSQYRKRLGHDPYDPLLSDPELLQQLKMLRTQNAELRDQSYMLAVRNNQLQLQIYRGGHE